MFYFFILAHSLDTKKYLFRSIKPKEKDTSKNYIPNDETDSTEDIEYMDHDSFVSTIGNKHVSNSASNKTSKKKVCFSFLFC